MIQKVFCFFSHGRQHRFEIRHEYPEQVDTDTAHFMHLLCRPLLPGQYPGFFAIDLLVGLVGQSDDFAYCLIELALFI